MPRAVVIGWIITALFAWGGLFVSLPGYYRWFIEQPMREGFNAQAIAIAAVSGVASLLSAAVSMALAVFIYKRKPDDRPAVYISFYLLLFGLFMSGPLEMAEYQITGTLMRFSYLIQSVIFPVFGFLLLLQFPNGIIAPARFRWLIPLIVLFSLASLFIPVEDQIMLRTTESKLLLGLLGGLMVSGVGAQVYRYMRVSSPLERQQTKIVLFGLVMQMVLMGISSIYYYNQPEGTLYSLQPETIFMNLLWWISLTMLPISLTVAVVRSHLWDIDVVIRRTLTYGILTAALALVYFGIIIFLQYTFRVMIGHETPFAVVLTTLAIAALFTPLRGAIQAVIDRRFFRSKYNAEQAMVRFQYSARDRVDLDGLEQDLTAIVRETMQPEWASLWIRKTGNEGKAAGNAPGG